MIRKLRLNEEEVKALVYTATRHTDPYEELQKNTGGALLDAQELLTAKFGVALWGELRALKSRLADLRARVTTRGTVEEAQLIGEINAYVRFILLVTGDEPCASSADNSRPVEPTSTENTT